MSMKVLVLLAIVAIGFESVQGDAVELETNYDSYRTIVNGIENFSHKIRVLQAVWAEILLKYPSDEYKSQALFVQLAIVIKGNEKATVKDLQEAKRLQQEVAQYVINQSSLHVAKILNVPQYPTGEDLYFIVLPFLENTLRVSIYESAIDKIYNFGAPQRLAAHFEYLRENVGLASSEDLIRAQLYLYWKFLGREESNDVYLFNVAYYFLQIKSNSEYDNWPTDIKLAINKAISKLPTSLKYLFFEPKFCLLNKVYPEFIYTTESIDIDNTNVHIFNWVEKSPVDEHGEWLKYITTLDTDNVPVLHLSFTLISKKFGRYMHRASIGNYTNIIASRKDGTLPPNREFSVEYHDNTLAFKQNGFVMCATDELFDKDRRFVYGLQDDRHTGLTPACQWIARECY